MSAILKTTTSVGAKSPAQLYIISLYRKMLRASKTKDPSISTAVKGSFYLALTPMCSRLGAPDADLVSASIRTFCSRVPGEPRHPAQGAPQGRVLRSQGREKLEAYPERASQGRIFASLSELALSEPSSGSPTQGSFTHTRGAPYAPAPAHA
jgi:hypothetical protein